MRQTPLSMHGLSNLKQDIMPLNTSALTQYQIPLRQPTFTETSRRGKSWTQITKVADKNNLDMSRCLRQSLWKVRDKPVCVTLMEFSPLQCTGKVGDKVSRTQITKVRDTNHDSRRHDLCHGLSWFVIAKVGVMEFGLKQSFCYRDCAVTASLKQNLSGPHPNDRTNNKAYFSLTITSTTQSTATRLSGTTYRSPGDFCLMISTSRNTTAVPPAAVDSMSPCKYINQWISW